MSDCECHYEATDSHDSCCGHEDGRNPDCPIHGDGSGPRSRLYADRIDNTVFGWPEPKPKRTLPEALDAAKDGKEFMAAIQGLFGALEQARDEAEDDDEMP